MIQKGQQLYLDRQKHLVEATTAQAADADGPFFCFRILDSQIHVFNQEGVAVLDNTDTWQVAWVVT